MNNAQLLALIQLTAGEFIKIRFEYMNEIRALLNDYFSTDKARVTRFQNRYTRAVATYFDRAFEMGIVDGGGGLPAEGDALAWITAQTDAEVARIPALMQQLKNLKSEGPDAWTGVPEQYADSYARTLDQVYSEGKLRGAGNKMLTFGGEDGEESCATCQKLKGQRHRASWWIKHGYQLFRGNPRYECGVWQCQHYFFTDDGNLFTF
jgi:hypothetical protein